MPQQLQDGLLQHQPDALLTNADHAAQLTKLVLQLVMVLEEADLGGMHTAGRHKVAVTARTAQRPLHAPSAASPKPPTCTLTTLMGALSFAPRTAACSAAITATLTATRPSNWRPQGIRIPRATSGRDSMSPSS
eukprot:366232-Chlamydomonas_euryale.AAC.10